MICTKCGISFELIMAHYDLVHLGKKENRCLYCAKLFDNAHLMFDHISEHDGSVFCYFCKEASDNYELLMCHINIHPELHVYCCYQCYWTCANKLTLMDHVCQGKSSVNSDDSGVESNPVKKKEKVCSRINAKLKQQKGVEKRSHRNVKISSKLKDPRTLKFIASCLRTDGYYHCSACPKQYKTLRGFRYHLLRNNNLMKFVCGKCGRKFPNNNKLQDHRKLHDSNFEMHQCPECFKLYKTKYSLFIHSAKHRGGFICSHCSSKFSTKDLIKRHLNIQECCEELFRCRNLFDKHLRTTNHSFPCQYCRTRFVNDLHLKRHVSMYHREEVGTHRCTECDIIFRGAHNLARHIRRTHRKRTKKKRKKLRKKK